MSLPSVPVTATLKMPAITMTRATAISNVVRLEVRRAGGVGVGAARGAGRTAAAGSAGCGWETIRGSR